MWKRYALFALCMGLVSAGHLRAAAITTAMGANGADTFVELNGITGAGTGTDGGNKGALNLQVRTDTSRHRITYLRFDLANNGISPAAITAASLQLKTNANGAFGQLMDVFGLVNDPSNTAGNAGEFWSESTITYGATSTTDLPANSPARPVHDNTGSNVGASTAYTGGATNVVYLGSFAVPGTNSANINLVGTLSSSALVSFLNADTNGVVTLIVDAGQANIATAQFYAKETTGAGAMAPTLNLTVPEPTSIAAAGFISSLALRRRRAV